MTQRMTGEWQSASFSSNGANCVQARWAKSSFSGKQGNCVQVRGENDMIEVRDSKLGDASPILAFTQGEWEAFIAGAKDGEFDI